MRRQRRRAPPVFVALAALLVAGAVAARASASWNITQRQAHDYAVQVAHERYGFNRDRTSVECTPRYTDGFRHYPPGHRWVCLWVYDAESTCQGSLTISGSNHAAFRYVLLEGRTCEPVEESD
jgi:hypothetical protein